MKVGKIVKIAGNLFLSYWKVMNLKLHLRRS